MFLYSFNMTSKGEPTNKEEGAESSFTLEAMQQQFGGINLVFNEIRDKMDRQDAIITNW